MPKGLTLKGKRLLKELPNAPSIRQAGIKAGYTQAGNCYRKSIKEHIARELNIDSKEVIRRFNEIYTLALADKDLTNMARITESLARINAMFTDKTINQTTISNKDNEILKRYMRIPLNTNKIEQENKLT